MLPRRFVPQQDTGTLTRYSGRLSRRGTQTVDGPLDVDDVELASGVLTEGADPQPGLDGIEPRPGGACVSDQSPDPAAAVVGEQVDTFQLWHPAPVIDITPGDDTA